MATITVSDAAYARLADRAAAAHTTVEALIESWSSPEATGPVAADGPADAFAAWMARVDQRADRYPAGFVADASREAIYDRGEE